MASLIIPASKSLTITDRFPSKSINKGIISIGNDGFYNYISYLFFDISAIPFNVSVCYAELVLFKVDKFYKDYRKVFGVYPLNEYFSSYTNFNNYPKINRTLQADFYPLTSKAAVTIPVTSFVQLWLENYHVNTSIMLCGRNKHSLVHFGSAICRHKYLTPFLKINIEPCCYNESIIKQKNTSRIFVPNTNNIENIDDNGSSISKASAKNQTSSIANMNINDKITPNKETIPKTAEPIKSELLSNSLKDVINEFSNLLTGISLDNFGNIPSPLIEQFTGRLTELMSTGSTYDENPIALINNLFNTLISILQDFRLAGSNEKKLSTKNDTALNTEELGANNLLTKTKTSQDNNELISSPQTTDNSFIQSPFKCILDKLFCLIIDILFNCCNKNPTLWRVHVTGTVAPNSKYISVIYIEIFRHCPKHTDRYYVADEYDNSAGNTPLTIDKIYNIAVVPPKNIFDTEKITLYSSYKE